ncbi:MAG: hypothetical protein JNL55_16825 [Steroidobacter sp.]|nr:hypothetical protein [Steroidobacter sp.]
MPEGIEFSISAINALKIETDGVRQMADAAAIAYNNLAIAVANAPIERMKEISAIVGQGYLDAQREFQQETTTAVMDELQKRNEAVAAAAEYQYDVQLQAEEAIRQQKAVTVSTAISFLHMLGQKNKAAAIAGIVLEKAVAIQRLLMQNQIAAWLAYSAALVPGNPASLAVAEGVKASVLAQGYVSAALIAGMGALQIADVTSRGGRSSIGTPLNPAYTTSSGDSETAQGASSTRSVQIIIQGNVVGNDSFIRELIDGIRAQIDDNDVVLIGPNSRQASAIRDEGY